MVSEPVTFINIPTMSVLLWQLLYFDLILEYSTVVYKFGGLLRLFPRSLSHQSLLLHSAWQAANDKVKGDIQTS